MPSHQEVTDKRYEVEMQILAHIQATLPHATAKSIESYANAYALIHSGKPASTQVDVNQK